VIIFFLIHEKAATAAVLANQAAKLATVNAARIAANEAVDANVIAKNAGKLECYC
jgi:hypothetical protein